MLLGLLGLLFAATAHSMNVSQFSVSRNGVLEYSATVTRHLCSISWSGARGVWKQGDYSGTCGSSFGLFQAQADAVARPPFPFFFKNASDWAVLTLDDLVLDTRNTFDADWDQALQDTIKVFELVSGKTMLACLLFD
jgi:hypothetical protein